MRLRFLAIACSAFSISALHSIAAYTPSKAGALENFDKRAVQRRDSREAANEQGAALAELQAQQGEIKVEFDKIIGSPRLISPVQGFLTGPGGKAGSIAPAALQAFPANDSHRPIKAFLRQHSRLFGHGPEALTAARLQQDYVTAHNGLRTVVWAQQLDGIAIFDGLLIGHLTKRGELVNLSSRFVPQPLEAANKGTVNRAQLVAKPVISVQEAILRAAENIGTRVDPNNIAALSDPGADIEKRQSLKAEALKGEIRARLVWLPMNRSTMRLCWQVELTSRTRGELFRVLVDAQTGEALIRHCLTYYISEATYRVFTSDSPSPFSPGHAVPSTGQPPLVERQLVTLSALSTNASPNGWIDDGGNELRGNNVDAHLDRNDDDLADLPRPQGSPNRVFDFPMDLTKAPSSYGNAAVVQVFYWNNWIHDKLYELGFTEAAGNFQKSNFNRGGLASDAVEADAQDGGGFNSSNFSAPSDGIPGRMQIYIFDGASPDRDGDLDAEVLLHEYTHGLSSRLVGGGSGLTEPQSRGMGEGWSDFYALALLSEEKDDLDGNYAVGAYLSYQLDKLTENYYFGIRRYPYTTDLTRNPLTFKDIDSSQAERHGGVPLNPTFGETGFAEEVHSLGELWCVTLWEARANLIRKHGFATGNELILRLVTDGMKLSPPNPNFLEARDAILQADRVQTGGANRDALWSAFAKRGMGFSATSPQSSTTSKVLEAFDVPDDLLVTPNTSFLSNGPEGGPFAELSQVYSLSNVGTNKVIWSATKNAGWFDLSMTNGFLVVGAPPVSIVASLNSAASSLPSDTYGDTITFADLVTGRSQTRPVLLRIGQPDFFTQIFVDEDNDLANQTLTFSPDGSKDFYAACREEAISFPTDPSTGQVLSLGDDGYEQVTLSDGARVSLYGTNYGSFYVSANGSVTFNQGVSEFSESLEGHFSTPRISMLFDDLDPSAQGIISWRQLPDRVTVTFENVPNFFAANRNSFQLEMFFDGKIRLTYLEIESTGSLVGLSNGSGLPPGFVGSDFQSYTRCLPFLHVTLPPEATEGQIGVVGTIGIPEPLTTNLVVALTSLDVTEVTVPSAITIPLGETSASFPLTILDDSDLDGTKVVRILVVSEGFRTACGRIRIHDNESATLVVKIPLSAREGDGLLRNQGKVMLDRSPSESVVVTLSSSDTTEVETPKVVVIPTGQREASFDLNIIDDSEIDDTSSTTITAQVSNWIPGSAEISVLDNESKEIFVTLSAVVGEGAGRLKGAGTVRLSGTSASDLTIELFSSDTTEIALPATVIVPKNTNLVKFDLTILDDAEIDGPQTVSIAARALGFANGIATLIINDNETPPMAVAPHPPHLSTNNSPRVDLSWNTGEGEILINGDFETGDFSGWARVNTGSGDFVINDGTVDPEGPDDALAPSAGGFAALSQQTSAGRNVLYQDVTLSPGAISARLSWDDRIRNHALLFVDPIQEFRVEIRSTVDNVLATAYSTDPGDVLLGDWTRRTFDLSEFIGKTIRIAFVEEDSSSFFNVHLDNISVVLGKFGETTYDVYFGNNPAPGAAEFLGNSTRNHWDLPSLKIDSTYYWQIIAKRGSAQIPGPVWQFGVPGVGPIDHFAWNTLASPQFIDQPISVAVEAKDLFDNTATNFNEPVTLSARVEFPELTMGSGTQVWDYPLGGFFPDSRIQVIYPASEIGPARRITALSLYVENARPQPVNRFTIRIKHTPLLSYASSPAWERTGWITVYQKTLTLSDRGWLRFDFITPFDYDGTSNLMIDLSHRDSASFSSGGECRYSLADDLRSISYQSFGDFGDPLAWAGSGSPLPDINREVPNMQLFSENPVAISPVTAGPFVNGVWAGEITIQDLTPGITLRADDSEGHSGKAASFDTAAQDDVALNFSVVPSPVTTGQDVVYVFEISNSGPSPATGVILTSSFPPGLNVISAVSSQGQLVKTNGSLVCELGTLANQSNATVRLTLNTISFTGSVTNLIQVRRNELERYTRNDSAAVVTQVNPVPTISINDITIDEGSAGTTNAIFTVRLSLPSSQTVSVNYRDVKGTADETDYTPISGLLTFLPGVTAQNIAVRVISDTVDELDETFSLNLYSPTNATLARPLAEAKIVDDDGPGISISDVQVNEGAKGTTNALFLVSLTSSSLQPVTVDYATADGSALAGSDYEETTGSLTFAPGTTNQSVAVLISGDTRIESNERFFIHLFNATQATISREQGVATIVNDDGLPGNLDHFDWETVASPQIVNQAFAVTVLGKDAFNRPATNFAGVAKLSGEILYPDTTIGNGDLAWDEPLGVLYEDSRVQTIYLASEIGPARPLTALALNFAVVPDLTLHRFNIRMKQTTLSGYGAAPSWERAGWTIVYRKDELITETDWVTFEFTKPFAYDGLNNLLVDISFNNSEYSFSGAECLSTETDGASSIWYAADSDSGDPLNWLGRTPVPEIRNQRLNVRFSSQTPVAVAPVVSENLVNGVWSGSMIVQEIAAGMVLRADDGEGHLGRSDPFTMTALDDLFITTLDSPDPVTIEQPLTYRYTVYNSGPSTSTGVILSNTLPQGVSFVSALTSQGSYLTRESTLLCDLGTILGGSNATVTVTVQAPATGGLLTNRVTVLRKEADNYLANNAAVEFTTVYPRPSISISDMVILEGDSGTTRVDFHVSLSLRSSQEVAVSYATANSSAEQGNDYIGASGKITFAPGTTNQPITIQIMGDTLDEAEERFFVNLSDPINAVLSDGQAAGRIIDDDGPQVSINKITIAEGDSGTNNAVFNVRLSAASPQTVIVDYETADGSSSAGSDYLPTSGSLSFRPGVTNQSLTVRIKGDITIEPDETFFLNLLSATNAAIQVAEGLATIANDDGLPGELDHFSWGPIPSPKTVNQPFAATLFAQDGLNQPAINFTGTARLTGEINNPDADIGDGTTPWDYPLGGFYTDSRLQTIFLAKEIGTARRLTGLAVNLSRIQALTLDQWTIRMKHTTLSSYSPSPSWERTGWTIVYQAHEAIETTGWVTFLFDRQFDFNGTSNLMIDFSFHDENLDLRDGQCFSTDTPEARSISYQSFGLEGDPLTWAGSNPLPEINFQIPNIRLSTITSVTIEPTNSGSFVNGRWVGTFRVPEPATNLTFRATGLLGHSGAGNKFTVIRTADADQDGLPDDWELANRLNPNDKTDGTVDSDQDGLDNRSEYLAGTDPHDAESSLRILLVGISETEFRFSFRTALGRVYEVEKSVDLKTAVWTILKENIEGTGQLMEVNDARPSDTASVFYRMRLVP